MIIKYLRAASYLLFPLFCIFNRKFLHLRLLDKNNTNRQRALSEQTQDIVPKIIDSGPITPSIEEIIWVKNVRAIVVSGFLMKLFKKNILKI